MPERVRPTTRADGETRSRVRPNERAQSGGNYFLQPQEGVDFFSTGCKVLDLALGGGWAEDRMINIIGDRSTGKTLLAIEAAANFARKHEQGRILYREREGAFDQSYAEALGMPLDRVDFGREPLETVEDMFEELSDLCASSRKRKTLYIVDSLDALSDRAELKRKIDKGSFGAGKAAQLSELFRRLASEMNGSKITLMIISQIRDNIGVMFGRKWKRSGGHSMDFYASQALVLSQREKITKRVDKVERAVGILVRGYVDKCKVGMPFREAEFPLMFGYGIDDHEACMHWLEEVGVSQADRNRIAQRSTTEMHAFVERKWFDIESKFIPTRRKYE